MVKKENKHAGAAAVDERARETLDKVYVTYERCKMGNPGRKDAEKRGVCGREKKI